MGKGDELLNKPDPGDVKAYDGLVNRARMAKRKIESGFLDLAESIFEINRTRLYKLKYKTFSSFCEEELGFSRQTIYVYISILKLIQTYQKQFPREKAVEFGHKKMRHITEGIHAIDKSEDNAAVKEKKKLRIFDSVRPEMPSTEIEAVIEDIITE